MLNSLDLLVIVFMVLAALSFLALLLMFLIKNKIVRSVSIGLSTLVTVATAAFAVYVCGVDYLGQSVIGVLAALGAISAFVLDILNYKLKNDKIGLAARITSAAALVVGVINSLI